MIETWSARTPGGERVPGKWRAAALYALLTVALTYPLSVTPGSTVLAHYPDDELLMWVLAWDAHAFTHQPLSIFEANIFYPERRTLAYSENLIGNAFVAAPVIWSTNNPVLALNLVALLACALCGLGGYLLGVRVGLGMPGALVCGLIFAFSPPRFFRTPQIHLATVQWMPFALASLHAYQDGRRPRDLRIAIAFFTLQALASGHGAVFLACAIGLVLTYGVVLGEPLDLKQRVRDLGISGLLLLIPAILMSDGTVLADFGFGYEPVTRACGNAVVMSTPQVFAGNGVVLSPGSTTVTYTQPVPNQATPSQQNLPSAQSRYPILTAVSQSACFTRDAQGRFFVAR